MKAVWMVVVYHPSMTILPDGWLYDALIWPAFEIGLLLYKISLLGFGSAREAKVTDMNLKNIEYSIKNYDLRQHSNSSSACCQEILHQTGVTSRKNQMDDVFSKGIHHHGGISVLFPAGTPSSSVQYIPSWDSRSNSCSRTFEGQHFA